jgi:hypothetical protein
LEKRVSRGPATKLENQIRNSKFAIRNFLMPDPEIARRCSVCGATVRHRALFCPQCGHRVANQDAAVETDSERARSSSGVSQSSATESVQGGGPDQAMTQPLVGNFSGAPDSPSGQTRTTMHRATNVAKAGFEDNVLAPVEKLRKVSSIVIDQAGYDHSLRFLLVAAVLFLVFLVLLVLSKVIG